jgi:serine/threonine protein kinase
MTCETVDGLLLDYVEGELAPDQAQAVQAHLDQCRSCHAKYRQTRALVGDLSAARSVEERAWRPDDSRTQPLQPTTLEQHARIGDFEIISELGRGGMGVVYRARQITLNRVVALKVLSAGLVQSERSVTRFAREAQAAARLHHTNIVPVYAQGKEGDCFYYAMELIDGQSLADVLREQRAADDDNEETLALTDRDLDHGSTHRPASAVSRWRSAVSSVRLSGIRRIVRPHRDYRRIVRLVAGVAEGLHHAHEQNVVHRDIKPQNLLLGTDGELHITDFGLARLLDEPGLTLSSEMVGTPAYMAPEQIVASGEGVDRRTDVYALGVTLYEMLTLRRPFRGDAYDQTIHLILHREPTPPRKIDPHIPLDLETICLRAMDKEPRRRFSTAGELARDLRRYGEGFPIVSRRIGPVGRTVRWIRRRPWRSGAIAASVFLMVVGGLAYGFLNRWGNAKIEAALTLLLDDYREPERALAELGWASRIAGDRYRRRFVEALANIRTKPERTVEILTGADGVRPDDPDGHYLLARAYTRLMRTRGIAPWADAQRHLEIADGRREQASYIGHFFRGQTLREIDPESAVGAFEDAITKANREGFNFTQAMLHQGRAMNQIMYSWRALKPWLVDRYYQRAASRLETVGLLQPEKAYPRYLYALTHLMAAERYALALESARDAEQASQLAAERDRAYQASIAAARDAQRVEPTSPGGYMAEAYYHESRRDFTLAIRAWNQFDNGLLGVVTSESACAERFEYDMRLHFWLAQYGEAEWSREQRYSERGGYNGDTHYDSDEGFYEALIAASAGNLTRAERALAGAVARVRGRPEHLLRLDAAYRLIGRAPPADLLVVEPDAACKRSPGWSAEFVEALIQYQRGAVAWEQVDAAAETAIQWSDDARLRRAGAYYFRGVRELAAGARGAASASLAAAGNQYDNENYCFRAKLLLVKLEQDPRWPAWLRSDDPVEP